jgi:hypothetical protein
MHDFSQQRRIESAVYRMRAPNTSTVTRDVVLFFGARRTTSANLISGAARFDIGRARMRSLRAPSDLPRRSCHARHTNVEPLYLSAANSAAVFPLCFHSATRADHAALVAAFMHSKSHF